MDPNACYKSMVDASNEGNRGLAKEFAIDLKNWLDRGGFEPTNYDNLIHSICLIGN